MSNHARSSVQSLRFRSLRDRSSCSLLLAFVYVLLGGVAIGQADNTAPTSQTYYAPPTGQLTAPANGQDVSSQVSVMSADQIIGILREDPTALADVRNIAAQQLGVDPASISDTSIFNQIQHDANLRAQLTKELSNRGYSNTSPDTKPSEASDTAQTSSHKTARPSGASDQDLPQIIQRPSPYVNLPSLDDLYSQIPSSGGQLRRFGSDAFLIGTGNANELPIDLPVGPDYPLGPGDNIIVNMWGGHTERLNLTIDRQGQITLPEAGAITLDRLTIAKAQDAIQKALSTQFQDEHVEISLGRLRTVRVYVVGDVQRPGAYDVSSMSTPLNALYLAGGPTSHGSLRILRQYRSGKLVREIDLYDFLLKGVRSDSDRLLPGDTVLVPPAGPQVSIEGMVHRPAIYELNGEEGLQQVLDLAGGVLVSADLKQINIERIEAHQRRTMVTLELPDDAGMMEQKLAGFRVQDGDDVVISRILPYNQRAVYLEGHVFRPGKYPYQGGMTINDLLHSYQDVMPEPSDHVELVRLRPPDYRPETTPLSLSAILSGNSKVTLQPLDLIRVFSRYEIDPPKVSIEGDVIRPGEYPMSQGMTVTGLIEMAGGFKRSAYRNSVDLTSYTVENDQKVVIGHRIVEIGKAQEGDKTADETLKPGDLVGVRQLTGWQDIGASVVVAGEVAHAGTYGLNDGERLSSVIQRAGGFRDSAYPAAAVLQRVQVRQLGEQARLAMIRRIETTPINTKPGLTSTQDQAATQQSLVQQKEEILASLRSHPASDRMVINISEDINKWKDTSADVELRAGDTLIIPKKPSFVAVSGQVYNPTAITFAPGKSVGWYLQRAGGVTPSGDKKSIYVLRADGSVIAHTNSWDGGSIMGVRLHPGDTVTVPEKLVGGSEVWRNIIAAAQVMSSIAIAGAIAGAY